MADIVLNVELRERSGSGGARALRRDHQIPGVLYGGSLGPVPVAVKANEFRKALYTGKLLGHLVTLKHGKETQRVITKDVQFHPVSDIPIHFVAQKTKLCSFAMSSTFPELTSVFEPRRPCP